MVTCLSRHSTWMLQLLLRGFLSCLLFQSLTLSPIDSAPPHFRHTLWWVCGRVWSKCGSHPHLARTMAARACNQTLAPQFNHKTCYLSGGFVVQVWWVCGPALWWGCGVVVGLYPTTPTPHNCHTCPPTFRLQLRSSIARKPQNITFRRFF